MWIILSLISALTLSLRDVSIKKKALTSNPLFSSIAMLTIILPILIMIIVWKRNFNFTLPLFCILIAASILDSFAIFLYSKALFVGKLSLSTPLLAFIPVFQVIFSFVFLDETTSIFGIFGIILSIVFVFYGNKFEIKKIVSDQSSIYMIGVSLLWGASSLLHKVGASYFSPLLWTSYVCTISLTILIIFALITDVRMIQMKKIPSFWISAISHFLTLVSFYGACTLGNVAYVSSIRRLSAIFSVGTGFIFFKEKLSMRVFITTLGLIMSATIITLMG